MQIRQWFQALQIVYPATVVSALSVGTNVLFNQLFIHGIPGTSFEGLGFIGSPIATAVSYTFQLSLFCSYVFLYRGYHKEFWGGWSADNFTAARWRKFLAVVIPMQVGNALQSWGAQLLSMLSLRLGNADAAAMAIMSRIWGMLWAFYWGFGLALQIRVGRHLGRNDPEAAKASTRVAILSMLVIVIPIAAAVIAFRESITRLFDPSDETVLDLGMAAMPYCVADFLINTFGMACTAVLEGMSQNAGMASVQIASTWLVSLPFTLWLGFFPPEWALSLYGGRWELHSSPPPFLVSYFLVSRQPVSSRPTACLPRPRHVLGLWTGKIIGSLFSLVCMAAVVIRSDWQDQAWLAIRRAKGSAKKGEEEETLLDA